MSASVTLVDYGMGNLPNVARAFERVGARASVTDDPEALERAERVVVPGVGACGDAMANLRAKGLDRALLDWLATGRPFLGICLGLQLLLERAEEGDATCLGVIPGSVEAFSGGPGAAGAAHGLEPSRARAGAPGGPAGHFYFVHGFRAAHVPDEYCLGRTEHGERFVSAVGRENFVAVQFHPEKSQRAGLALLERFCGWSP